MEQKIYRCSRPGNDDDLVDLSSLNFSLNGSDCNGDLDWDPLIKQFPLSLSFVRFRVSRRRKKDANVAAWHQRPSHNALSILLGKKNTHTQRMRTFVGRSRDVLEHLRRDRCLPNGRWSGRRLPCEPAIEAPDLVMTNFTLLIEAPSLCHRDMFTSISSSCTH